MKKIKEFFNDYKEVIIEGTIQLTFTILGCLATVMINNKANKIKNQAL